MFPPVQGTGMSSLWVTLLACFLLSFVCQTSAVSSSPLNYTSFLQ